LLALAPLSAQALELNVQDSGRTISVPLTEVLWVTLPGNPTTGYRWELAEIDREILATESETAFTPDSARIGAGGEFRFLFTTVKQGTTIVKLIYRRPWEKNEQPLKTYNLTVSVTAAEQQKTAVYQSSEGKLLEATFNLKLNQVLVILPNGQKVTLPSAVSGSGARYSNGTETFWEHQATGSFMQEKLLLFEGSLLRTHNK